MKIPAIKKPVPETNSTIWFNIDDQKLRLVHTGAERLKALMEMLDQAQVCLKLFYYIFEDDYVGELVLGKLIAACERGVAVELIIDSFGSNRTAKDFFAPFIHAGGRFAIFSPSFSTSYFVRNHQKMLIADDQRALIGGFNIGDQYFHLASEKTQLTEDENRWDDLGLEIQGTEVEKLAKYYQMLGNWVYEDNGNIRSLRKIIRNWESGNDRFRWLLGGPSNRLSSWAWSIKKDLEKGQKLDLVAAYFSPGQGLLRRIARLSKRGGDSRIILPGKTDNAATIGASRLLYGYLLNRNAQLYEYQKRRLHMKLVAIDDAVYIGSANFDLRSIFINVEMMLRVEDAKFARHVRQQIDELLTDSEKITPTLHKSRLSFLNRFRWTLCYFVVNTLDYTVNRRLNFGIKR